MLCVLAGSSLQLSAGDTSGPSQVNFLGMSLPGVKAALFSSKVMAFSPLLEEPKLVAAKTPRTSPAIIQLFQRMIGISTPRSCAGYSRGCNRVNAGAAIKLLGALALVEVPIEESTQPDCQILQVCRGDCQAKRSEEHTSELQSPCNLVCRLLLEKKKKNIRMQKYD